MRVAAATLLVLALAGCGASPFVPPPTAVALGISNGTQLDVTVFVNGRQVAAVPANGPQPTVDPSALPPLPWHVEARTSSGRVLTSMNVAIGQVGTTTGAAGEVMHRGAMSRIDLSCGRLTVWAGDVEPSGPAPPPSPGFPGDCAP